MSTCLRDIGSIRAEIADLRGSVSYKAGDLCGAAAGSGLLGCLVFIQRRVTMPMLKNACQICTSSWCCQPDAAGGGRRRSAAGAAFRHRCS